MSAGRPIAIVCLTAAGGALAANLRAHLPGAVVHGLADRVTDADVAFTETGSHLRSLFAANTPIVGVCASGILVRALAPLLTDKRSEPPVIALGEDGGVAVPLLGGHHGANALARTIAAATGGAAAITTAGELAFGVALDDPPPGWTLANPAAAKPVMAALLAGEPVALEVMAGDADWLAPLGARLGSGGRYTVRVTDRVDPPPAGTLVVHPPTLALGVGNARGAGPVELIELATATLADAGLAAASVGVVVSLDLKADEPAVHALARQLGVPARFFDAATLEAETPRLANPSEYVFRTVGCHGVAEGAALAAAGPAGTLVAQKRVAGQSTCAVARGPVIDGAQIGRPQGRLAVIGIGPGDAAYRTPTADAALAAATDIVGYRGYTDQLGARATDKAVHAFPIGAEVERCRRALDLAADGGQVALVSSGDPGVYAMAALVFELLEADGDARWQRIALTVEPGVSAMQLAAARAGAPLGQDFCAISLSDLLVPWPEIERRLRAAAAADFVVALYNPASARRRHQLAAARDILAAERPSSTPVVVARNLARAAEEVTLTTLGELDPARVDMMTIVLVGNRSTRALADGGWVFTPRGYDATPAPRRAGAKTGR